MVNDLAAYISCFWGRFDQVLFFLNYFTYTPQLMAVPFICLLASLLIRCYKPLSLSPACMFTPKYLFSNTQSARCPTVTMELGHFALMLTWPVVNTILGFYNYATLEYQYSPVRWHMLASRIATAVGFVQYGCLTYLCFKLRKAFAKRFDEIAHEIALLNEDEGKSRICHIYITYKDFRDFAGYWMTFTLPVGAVGLASLITWHFGYTKNATYERDDPMCTYAIMIWSQKTMFLLQPLVAFYGVNADYLWDDFKDRVAERLMTAEKVGQSFHRLMRHMKEINHAPQWIISTLVFTIVGLYFGMHLKNQYFKYWIGPDCLAYTFNTSVSTSTTPSIDY